MPFAKPATTRDPDALRFQDLDGHLLIVQPTKVEKDVRAANGDLFDAVVCDVHVCDGEHAGKELPGMWFMGSVLRDQLEPMIGKDPVLGRLGIPDGKRYRLLQNPTDRDLSAAEKAWPQFADQPTATKPTQPKPTVGQPRRPNLEDEEAPF